MNPEIVLEGLLDVPEDDLAAVLAALPEHIALTRKEDGCLSFELTQDAHQPSIFHVRERFIDRNAFEQHQQRSKQSNWARVSERAVRHNKIREINQR